MKERWKQWLEKRGMEKWFKRDNLLILILSGVLLFIIALPTKNTESSEKNTVRDSVQSSEKGSSGQERDSQGSLNSTGASRDSTELSGTDYAVYLEERLKETLSGMSGVGKVEVMITLASSEELVVEKDTPASRSQTNETDSEGGSRIITQLEEQETTVYRSVGNDSEPYVVKTLLPKVEGVVVVAQGAGTGTVDKSITEIVQALFDIEAHKVKVVKMKKTE